MKQHGEGGGQGSSSCKGSRRLTLMSIIGLNNALYLLSLLYKFNCSFRQKWLHVVEYVLQLKK